mmetsp:Transcript_80097/g.206121  ORF Transcript_80097/g.206121 Transcript_80097/m.206121 type:complete len:215 (-) Transcript_80097:1004-1648(-)
MTRMMPLMSSPRAATSVAAMSATLPLRKLSRASSRWRWSLSPWMATTLVPSRLKSRSSWSHMRLVPQKMSPRRSGGLPTRCSRSAAVSRLILSFPTICTICVMSAFALSSSRLPICTWYGRFRKSSASFRTSFGHVAVKKSVWRWLGTSRKILRICGSKPMSSIRSASSRTSLQISESRTCRPSRKSFRRPGVAMRQWHPARMAPSCMPFGCPP